MTERSMQVVLVLLGAINAGLGALALIAPDTFFEQIGKYRVENSHYVGDVGAFTIAYGLALLIAARTPSWRVPVLVLGAFWFGFHALNHAFDTGEAKSEARGWADTIGIAFGGLLLAYLARASTRLLSTQPPGE
jgi:hypothetical protein